MKYTLLLPLAFTTLSFSMQFSPQQIKQNIAAARLHNRTSPLARLPREVQDCIAQQLEFNDRESDEEFVKNVLPDIQNKLDGSHTLGLPNREISDEIRAKYSGRQTPTIIVDGKPCIYDLRLCASPEAEKAFIALLKPHESPASFISSFPSVNIIYSRDRSKILMKHELDNNRTYFIVFDMRENKTLYADYYFNMPNLLFYKLLAVSNDGKNFSIFCKTDPAHITPFHAVVREGKYYSCGATNVCPQVEFNKQSTRLYNRNIHTIHPQCSEQEHQKRSKKNLALYLHQKGICKPFNYGQALT